MNNILLFENFTPGKQYTNLNIEEGADIYQVPFNVFRDDFCLGKIDEYRLCFHAGLYYEDIITDEAIQKYEHTDLSHIDVSADWTRSIKQIYAKQDTEGHIMRVAKLVQELKKGLSLSPISLCFDERAYEFAPNYIEDGNHRLRALWYLKFDYFPAYIYGSHADYLIEYIEKR